MLPLKKEHFCVFSSSEIRSECLASITQQSEHPQSKQWIDKALKNSKLDVKGLLNADRPEMELRKTLFRAGDPSWRSLKRTPFTRLTDGNCWPDVAPEWARRSDLRTLPNGYCSSRFTCVQNNRELSATIFALQTSCICAFTEIHLLLAYYISYITS